MANYSIRSIVHLNMLEGLFGARKKFEAIIICDEYPDKPISLLIEGASSLKEARQDAEGWIETCTEEDKKLYQT